MEENNKGIRVEKRKFIVGFSETYPEKSLYEILSSFAENVIIHDFRGFEIDQSPEEGYVVIYYLSNKYLWVIIVETDSYGVITDIEVAKYSAGIGYVCQLPDELKLYLHRKSKIPLDCEEARLIAELINAKLPGEVR